MKIKTKIILACLIPLFVTVTMLCGVFYFYSQKTLKKHSAQWLNTRLDEALTLVKKQESILHRYGLEKIAASVAKAKLDALAELSLITMRDNGFVFIVDRHGVIVSHPDKYFVGSDAGKKKWFLDISTNTLSDPAPNQTVRVSFIQDQAFLVAHTFFPEWNWYLVCAEPMADVQKPLKQLGLFLAASGIAILFILSGVIFSLTARILRPTDLISKGLSRFGEAFGEDLRAKGGKDELSGILEKLHELNQSHIRSRQETDKKLAFFKTLCSNSVDLVTVTDSEGCLNYISPSCEKILGYHPDELRGKNLKTLAEDPEHDHLDDHFRLAELAQGPSPPLEIKLKHKQGHWCTLELVSRKISIESFFQGFLTFSRNIDRRLYAQENLNRSHNEVAERLENARQQITRLKTQLDKDAQKRLAVKGDYEDVRRSFIRSLDKFGKDIQNEITAVLGFSQILRACATGKKNQAPLSGITRSGDHLFKISKNMILLSRLIQNTLSPKPAKTDIHEIFESLNQAYKKLIITKPVIFIREVEAHFPNCLLIDRLFLYQILESLMDVAISFTSSGQIKLILKQTAMSEDGYDFDICLELNHGRIPKDLLVMLSDLNDDISFPATCPAPLSDNLFISSRLVKLLNGRLKVERDAGHLTRFTLCFTGIEACNAPELPPRMIDPEGVYYKGATVLIADASPHVNFVLAHILQQIQIRVLICDSEDTMIQLAQEQTPDLIFVSRDLINNPTGFTLSMLKHHTRTKKIPIIEMTACMEIQISKNKDESFAGSICKPFNLSQVYQLLEKYLTPTFKKAVKEWQPVLNLSAGRLKTWCTQNPDFRELFFNVIKKQIPGFSHGVNIIEIQAFSDLLLDTGTRFKFQELKQMGKAVSGYCSSFDIEKLQAYLNEVEQLFDEAEV